MAENKKNQLDLKHNIGDTIQLQFVPSNGEDRYYVKLIGFLEPKSILVTTPKEHGSSLHINNEQEFIVRLLSGNSAKGFNASVVHSTSHPYPHLHLTYPDSLESTTVRKAERIDCKLIVSVQNEKSDKPTSEGISAEMDNLSSAGAHLSCNVPIGNKGEKIFIVCKVHVADIEEYLNITGIIRRITEDEFSKKAKYEYGVEFNIDDNKEKLLLHGFIYEKMLNISA